MKIKIQRTISMGHRLPSYDGICSSPHGHNVTVEVHIHTMGEFIDFKRADDMLWSLLEDLDHAMVLYEEDPLIDTLDAMHFRVVVLNVEPTTENIATLIFNQVLDRDYNVEKVVVHETAKYAAIAERQDQRIERVR